MIIRAIVPVMLRYTPTHPPRDALAGIPFRDVFLVRVETDEGISGIGEGFALGSLGSLNAIVEEVLRPLLVGEDPCRIDYLWDKMYSQTFRFGRRGIVLAAISAIDIALWDILGKQSGLPVYKLLGGAKEGLPPYASGGYYQEGKDITGLVEEALHYKSLGYRAMKMKVGGASLQEDLDRIRAVREAIGPEMDLAIDANNAWDYPSALRVGRECDKLGLLFFEEPLSSDFLHLSKHLNQAIDVPVAGYETELTRFGMRDYIAQGGIDIVQTDAIWTGGISEMRRIGVLAGAWGMPVIPHFSASAVSLAANLHAGCSLNNASLFEYTLDDNPLRDDLLLDPIIFRQGVLHPSNAPGLGIELNPDVVQRYSVT